MCQQIQVVTRFVGSHRLVTLGRNLVELYLTIAGVVLAFITLVAGLWVARVAYRQAKPSQSVAQRELGSGPKMHMSFNGTEHPCFAWIVPWDADIKYLVDFEIRIANTGDKSLDDVFVILEVSSDLYPDDFPRKFDNSAKVLEAECVSDPIDGTQKTKVIYKVNTVAPDTGNSFQDFFLVGGTSRFKIETPVTTKDGINATVVTELLVGFKIDIAVVARDVPPIKRTLQALFLKPDDVLLQHLYKDDKFADEIIDLARAGGEFQEAVVLTIDQPQHPHPAFPEELASKFARVRLADAKRCSATYFSAAGFLPVTLNRV
jgi:hypothetical protein